MSEAIIVKGGNPLKGTVTPVPNKNAIVAALPASILTDKTVVYHNVPNTTDVAKILEMLRLLGAEVDYTDPENLRISCKDLKSYQVDKELGNLIRASIMFAGPLLARFGKAKIPVPGGCVLGKRSISAHVDAFQKAGVDVSFTDHYAVFTAPTKPKTSYNIWQFEASVTATENICMYAAGIDSNVVITDAASEPHVTQLTNLLENMGAKITGKGSNHLEIKGSNNLKGADFTAEPDHVDIGGLIVATAVTKGQLTLKNANTDGNLRGMLEWFEKFNISIEKNDKDLIIDGAKDLFIDVKNSGFPLAGDDLPKLAPRPWPGFPADVLPVMVTLASKTKGKILIQNWMYENGLDFIKELNALGANIFMADPQRIIVYGPAKFKGGKIRSPGIIQACKAIFLASLADDVETTIVGADILKRRYPDIINVYNRLGADIQAVS
jgi:UDP-N-acetylglucosamine 1-carboxyvinyltransferase